MAWSTSLPITTRTSGAVGGPPCGYGEQVRRDQALADRGHVVVLLTDRGATGRDGDREQLADPGVGAGVLVDLAVQLLAQLDAEGVDEALLLGVDHLGADRVGAGDRAARRA